MRKVSFFTSVLLAIFMLLGCFSLKLTLNFPVQAVEDAAVQFENDVRSADEGDKTAEKDGDSSFVFPASFFVSSAYAAEDEVDINLETPAIKALKAARTKRYPQIEPYLKDKKLGENNQGYLEILNTDDMDLRAKAGMKKLVDTENKDRESIYNEILKANKWEQSKLPDIEKAFAKAIAKSVDNGTMLQDEKGKWYEKKPKEK